MQHERHGQRLAQPADQLEVEGCRAVGHRVRRTHGHGERVDAGRGHERPRLVGVGADSGSVGAVFAADLAQLALDVDAGRVGPLGDGSRDRHVLVVGQRAAVEHDRAESEGDGLVDELGALGVIEVHRDRRRCSAGDREGRHRDRLEAPVIVGAVLRDLQDHGQVRCLRGAHEPLGGLEVDHVERADADAACCGIRHQFAGGDQGHRGSSRTVGS